ncbi:MAG: hypothetical protein A2Y56_10555 [Candidatus Aminicenantes bacterium RBG_13_63_10]|nr:MAG: hypothetical protein A2Y56_10555 [Candidatus Aminicenantes bacterium RBG_13_63_10]
MIVQVETSTDCNRSCWYCPNAHFPRRPSKVMSAELFEAVLDEVSQAFTKRQLHTVSLAAYNEPTLDPLFEERLLCLTRKGFDYYFITNGTGVTEALVDFLLRERVRMSSFHINLPAIDPEEYARTTGGRPEDVPALRRGLAYLFRHRADFGVKMSLVVHGDGGEAHRRNFERMMEFWREERIQVLFMPVMNRAGLLEEVIPPPIDHGTDRVWCKARHIESLYVSVEADLYLCCHDYHQQSVYGSLKRSSLRDLLRSEARAQAIREFKAQFCRRCSFAVKLGEVLQP